LLWLGKALDEREVVRLSLLGGVLLGGAGWTLVVPAALVEPGGGVWGEGGVAGGVVGEATGGSEPSRV